MAVQVPKQEYRGSVRPITIGSHDRAFTIGGDSAYPFYNFDSKMPYAPRIGIQVLDYAPDDWAESCTEPFKDVLADPVAWAKKAQDEYGADFIQLWLKSTDPNGLNRSADEAVQTAKAVADAISVPLIIWGTNNADKDAEVLGKVAEACAGKDIIIGPVSESNYKQLGAKALAYNLTVIATSPIDINLAKQLNILLSNLGVPLEKIIIDPTTGGLGYGLEYTFSVMERIRQAAITQEDKTLQCPFIANLADEVWKTKEAKMASDEQMGDARKRGILMEALTATTLLSAGANMLVMRHPEAVKQVRAYIAELGGFELPKEIRKAAPVAKKTAATAAEAAASQVADSLKEGALCEIVKIMDMPAGFAPGYAIALIKAVSSAEAGDGILLSAGHTAPAEAAQASNGAGAAPTQAKQPKKVVEFKPAASWEPLADVIGNYEYKLGEMKNAVGKKVKLIQNSADPGQAHGKGDWRTITDNREAMLQQVKTSLHYWYGEGYGSEKRKKPA